MQVIRQCKMRFSINANYIHEVELDVVALDFVRIVLGNCGGYLLQERE